MPWKGSVMDQRVEFVMRAVKGGETISKLCGEYQISRETGYRWINRYKKDGSLNGLKDHSRRPLTSPGRTEESLENVVMELREQKGWGARKLNVLLGQRGYSLSPSTINRILVRKGVIRKDPAARKATKRFEREQCNQMAQMDFKGEYEVVGGKCYPLSFLDDCSRYLLGLWPLTSTGTEGVYESLKGHFVEVGMPESILTDHGVPWYSTTNGYGLTRLAVWLIKQGIILKFSGIAHPQTQGKVERFHRTLKERTAHRKPPSTLEEWKRWADEFRTEYNHERPHEAIGMKTPAEVYTQDNLRPYQEHPKEWEYTGGKVMRINTQGKLYYKGRYYFVCEALLNERVRTDEIDGRLVVTFRHMTVREIDLKTGATTAVILPASSYKKNGEHHFGPKAIGPA